MLAVVCPGQGSQTPGMLTPWLALEGTTDAHAMLASFSEAAGVDLISHGTTSDAETIRDTAVAQPLIVATSLLALRAVLDGRDTADVVDITAGHSVGEFAAAAVAGVLDDASAVGLVARRAAAMARAATAAPSGMSAVIGGDPQQVLAAIEAAGLWPANINSAGQTVAGGTTAALSALAASPPARARVIPLQVAGAFHTPLMDGAREAFEPIASSWPSADPRVTFLSDADGRAYTGGTHGLGTGPDVLARLVAQITVPVRWDLVQQELAARGVTAVLELAPGGVLTGIAKRALPGVERLAITSPSDVEAARDLVAAHCDAARTNGVPQ